MKGRGEKREKKGREGGRKGWKVKEVEEEWREGGRKERRRGGK